MAWVQAKQIARAILAGFERHYCLFQEITAGAQERFEQAQWQAAQAATRERIHFYDQRVAETVELLQHRCEVAELDEPLWRRVKVEYVRLLHQHLQPELAETFYNSVFCRLFHRRYYNNRNIFVRPAVSTEHIEGDTPAYHSYYPARDGFYRVIGDILDGFGFHLPFADRRRDVRNILQGIRQHFPPAVLRHQNFQLAVLSTPFYRNKGAYIIGKAINGVEELPFVVPVLNDERGGLFVDTLLLGEAELSSVFSFTRAYFMVDTQVPSAVVDFLCRLLPRKTKAELYTAIGLQKHGKTEFYRDFLHHLRHSSDAFISAPGIRGMVMTVFTLPSYPYVFKVIKDRFGPPKDMSRDQVKQKYLLVKQHDRVGRMADSLEYSQAAFPLERFSPELLEELREECGSSVELDGEQIVIRHLYIERRMTPLNLYLQRASDQQLRDVIGGYGRAIKQLAAANIFPGDMLFKNFGVTRQGRVVFYDYDEICYLTECRFRKIPAAPYPEWEMSGEVWYSVEPQDVFPEEFEQFLLNDPRVRRAFIEQHADLLRPEYWWRKQENIRAGRLEDVFPYPESRRFCNQQAASCRSAA
jgi:isocitrate dehydrogenase kinase/phosphatase